MQSSVNPPEPLQDEDAGQLLAAIKNALPVNYSGGGVHCWVPSAAEMEDLGYLLHSLCGPGITVFKEFLC